MFLARIFVLVEVTVLKENVSAHLAMEQLIALLFVLQTA
jgi:hypothetical protein